MQIATTGLVLRQVKVGEADRILTILTPDLGVISASARGSLRMKSPLFSATGLFCYSEFSLSSGRSHFLWTRLKSKKCFMAYLPRSRAWPWPAIWRRLPWSFPPHRRKVRPTPSCVCC